MCVGVPAKVIERNGYEVTVDVMGSEMKVGAIFVDEVKVGDYVIVHAGQAMSIIDEQSAMDSIAAWRELTEARERGEQVPIGDSNPEVQRR